MPIIAKLIGSMIIQFERLKKFLPIRISLAISLLVIHASIFGVSSLRRRLTAVSPSINSIHREPRRDQFPVHAPSQPRYESATRALSPRRPSISVAWYQIAHPANKLFHLARCTPLSDPIEDRFLGAEAIARIFYFMDDRTSSIRRIIYPDDK